MEIHFTDTPHGYSNDYKYLRVTCDPNENEHTIRVHFQTDSPYKNKVVAIKERLDDWLITLNK